MNWDLTISGIVGYFAAMLYNSNNVAFEASSATTILEMLVGDDLCVNTDKMTWKIEKMQLYLSSP